MRAETAHRDLMPRLLTRVEECDQPSLARDDLAPHGCVPTGDVTLSMHSRHACDIAGSYSTDPSPKVLSRVPTGGSMQPSFRSGRSLAALAAALISFSLVVTVHGNDDDLRIVHPPGTANPANPPGDPVQANRIADNFALSLIAK